MIGNALTSTSLFTKFSQPDMTVTTTEQPEANLPVELPSSDTKTETQAPKLEGHYYQAIGWLHGVIAQHPEEKKFYITLNDGTQFRLTAKPHILFAINQQVTKNPDVALWLRCYPQYRMLQQDLFFSVISYNVEKPEEARDKIFIFRGIWQFIPQSKRPVFSIYRNQVQEGEKVKNQHLPLIWKEEQPFRFRKDSEARPQFFQIEARLLTQRACFGFSKSLAEPARPPRRVRIQTPGGPPGKPSGFKPQRPPTDAEATPPTTTPASTAERSQPLPKPRKKSEPEVVPPVTLESVVEAVVTPEPETLVTPEPETVVEEVVTPTPEAPVEEVPPPATEPEKKTATRIRKVINKAPSETETAKAEETPTPSEAPKATKTRKSPSKSSKKETSD
jgi:hypothetical protein